jgi:3',5'-cyclic AMP phosphodiesterase CpdA
VPDPRPPLLVAQLSDPHIGGDWGDGDPAAKLAAAVASVRRLRPRPDVVIVTGDLADHGADHEYELARELLEPLGAPTYVLPGNHDDRSALRRCFGLQGAAGEPVQYVVDLDGLRILMLDSTIPGEDAGAFDEPRLDWLEARLAEASDRPTLLAMHHPPLLTGLPAFDRVALAGADRSAMRAVVDRHPQVLGLVAGHVHRTITTGLAHTTVLTIPSTYVQGRLDFLTRDLLLADEPAGFGVHALLDGQLVSHIQPVDAG